MRLAWFSPVPPSPTGIAAYTAEIVPRLRRHGHHIDVFVHQPPAAVEPGVWPAQDFVWMTRRAPYDLKVYQLGNASYHDFMWGYLFRYPGLVVLHDAQIHQSRALAMTRFAPPERIAQFIDEFHANHPGSPPGLAELFAHGLGGTLFPWWPLVKLVVESARAVAVHNVRLAGDLAAQHPSAAVTTIPMGLADPWTDGQGGGAAVRKRAGIPDQAIVLAAYGGITPEKRIKPLLQALSAVADRTPLHLLLVGARAEHFDLDAEIARWRLADRVHVAGFVPDEELPAWLDAADVCACLRWPTNRETSASWLRCLAAGKPTIITGLADLADVPVFDPRGWRVLDVEGSASREPVAVSVEVVDELHALTLALDRLGTDAALRARLGRAARAWWASHHTLDHMAAAYEEAIALASAREAQPRALPPHLTGDVTSYTRELLVPYGLESLLP